MGFVKFWQCSARCVFFMVRSGRCVGLGFGVLWCVPVIYGEAGEVSSGRLCWGLVRFGRCG